MIISSKPIVTGPEPPVLSTVSYVIFNAGVLPEFIALFS